MQSRKRTNYEGKIKPIIVEGKLVNYNSFRNAKNKAEEKFDGIQRSIDLLNENFVSEKDFKNFVIYKGQKFEADAAYIDIYQQAEKSIYVIDDYVNTKTLQLLSQKQVGVEVVLSQQPPVQLVVCYSPSIKTPCTSHMQKVLHQALRKAVPHRKYTALRRAFLQAHL